MIRLWRHSGKTQTVKQWALEWGCSDNAARSRLYTLCGHKKAALVRT